ncbi:MAG: hypothetical protein MOGMAGMI_00440 [Candidatus Omnitrophica bacterium]|nr:hypothetical protein [Candidatus Omnitrophota bacterium]
MKILRDHILREFLGTFCSALVSLLFIFLLGRGLVQMADLIFNKDLDAMLVARLLALTLPFLLTFVIPMAVLVATLLTFGRLSSENEFNAMRASGVGLTRITTPLFAAVMVICLGSFLITDKVATTSHYEYRKLLTRIGLTNPAAALEEGTFIKKFDNFVIFIYEIEGNRLKGVRIYQPQPGKPTRTIVAEQGELIWQPGSNVIMIRLVHGTSDEPDPKDPSRLYKLNFKTYDLPLNMPIEGSTGMPGKKPKNMTVKELSDEIRRLGQDGIKATYPLSAEIHNKIAMSCSSLAFLLIGIPLGVRARRSERSIGLGISLVLMTLYWLLLIGGKTLAQKGMAPPFLSLQFSNFIVGGAGLALFFRLAGR